MGKTAERLHSVPGQREYAGDNLRFFLLFFVVFGHLLELCPPFWGSRFLYQLIYSFHIPALLFLFGYFCRFSFGKLLMGWVLPYVLFQTLYILFEIVILGTVLPLQYLTPYWLLWYLPVCIYDQLLLPVFRRVRRPALRGLLIGGGFLVAVAVGFWDAVGYGGSLSRFFVFFPFFLLGLYSRDGAFPRERPCLWKLCLGGAGVFALCFFFLYRQELPNALFYGARSYEALDSRWIHRVLILLCGLSATVSLFALSRLLLDRRLPLITSRGQNTLPIFLLHGFAVRFLAKFLPGCVEKGWQSLLLAVILVAVLGSPILGRGFRRLFSPHWAGKAKNTVQS